MSSEVSENCKSVFWGKKKVHFWNSSSLSTCDKRQGDRGPDWPARCGNPFSLIWRVAGGWGSHRWCSGQHSRLGPTRGLPACQRGPGQLGQEWRFFGWLERGAKGCWDEVLGDAWAAGWALLAVQLQRGERLEESPTWLRLLWLPGECECFVGSLIACILWCVCPWEDKWPV